MPKTHKVCEVCSRDTFKNPDLTVFDVRDKRGNTSLICEEHFESGQIVRYSDGRKRYTAAGVSLSFALAGSIFRSEGP